MLTTATMPSTANTGTRAMDQGDENGRVACGCRKRRAITDRFTERNVLYTEKLVTHAKKGGVHQQRLVVAKIHDKDAASKLFGELGPRYEHRNGGYLRILKLGPRPGDNAPMARVEFV